VEGTRNPVGALLLRRFEAALDELWRMAAPETLLDVGCGEGVLAERWARRLTDGAVVGIDVDDPRLRAEWENRSAPNLTFEVGDAARLFFGDAAFDTVTAIEVLEHVADPVAALREIARVAGRWMLVSVPREPLWRVLNVMRGAYLRTAGNSPGHVQHWSRRAFVALVSEFGEPVAIRSPLPWTLALVAVK
jgi:ubiquinone/menaquinone biosynthesis C-methylase UbiE